MNGYNKYCSHKQKLTKSALVILNMTRDLIDILYAFSPIVPQSLFDSIHLPRGTSIVKVLFYPNWIFCF